MKAWKAIQAEAKAKVGEREGEGAMYCWELQCDSMRWMKEERLEVVTAAVTQ